MLEAYVFYWASLWTHIKVSASSYVASNGFLDDVSDVYNTLKEWELSSNSELNEMAVRMMAKFEKY